MKRFTALPKQLAWLFVPVVIAIVSCLLGTLSPVTASASAPYAQRRDPGNIASTAQHGPYTWIVYESSRASDLSGTASYGSTHGGNPRIGHLTVNVHTTLRTRNGSVMDVIGSIKNSREMQSVFFTASLRNGRPNAAGGGDPLHACEPSGHKNYVAPNTRVFSDRCGGNDTEFLYHTMEFTVTFRLLQVPGYEWQCKYFSVIAKKYGRVYEFMDAKNIGGEHHASCVDSAAGDGGGPAFKLR